MNAISDFLLERSTTRLLKLALSGVLAASLFLSGCNNDDDEVTILVTGTAVSDFVSIADYLNDPTVQLILGVIDRHEGTTPPDVTGTYSLSDVEDIASNLAQDFESLLFCLGTPSGSAIDANILDSTIVDAGGSLSFVEGSGDSFTAYLAFRSNSLAPDGASCEIHQVAVISGTREADGSLSDVFVGFAVVGIVGDCRELFPGAFQIWGGTGARVGENGCSGSGSQDLVELQIENFLLNPVTVSLQYDDPALDLDPFRVG
ncbi:MAG: hypothetical protein AAF517_17845, partial [Planctomycetota bacterium]